MTYEVWSKKSHSVVAAFASENAALEAVREAITVHGRAYAEELALVREDKRGRSTPVAEGVALVEQALQERQAKVNKAAAAAR